MKNPEWQCAYCRRWWAPQRWRCNTCGAWAGTDIRAGEYAAFEVAYVILDTMRPRMMPPGWRVAR